jgi:hypothetical protein
MSLLSFGSQYPILEDKDNLIKEWPSISEAYLSLNKKITNGCINLACKGKIKTAFGYKWKYKNN